MRPRTRIAALLGSLLLAGAPLVAVPTAGATECHLGPRAQCAGADLHGANLRGRNLHLADLSGANLTRADLARASLVGANLGSAVLPSADLRWTNLIDTQLTGADLGRADVRFATYQGTNLSYAHINGVHWFPSNLLHDRSAYSALFERFSWYADATGSGMCTGTGTAPDGHGACRSAGADIRTSPPFNLGPVTFKWHSLHEGTRHFTVSIGSGPTPELHLSGAAALDLSVFRVHQVAGGLHFNGRWAGTKDEGAAGHVGGPLAVQLVQRHAGYHLEMHGWLVRQFKAGKGS